MKYFNIKNPSETVTFREALCRGISSDMGLFMPAEIPALSNDFFTRLPGMSLPQIAFEVGSRYIGNEIPQNDLEIICEEAFNFPVVVKLLSERKYVLELFHGPTAAFKDFGARFMSHCFRYFSSSDDRKTVVLVATSGDTGGAIANSFLGIDNIDVIILYPSGKVSELQEKQLTTLGQNITALEIEGTFDDCQAMVKKAFTSINAKDKVRLTSANSINIARLIPQSFYYYYAVGQIKGSTPVISVPSGNFGNITGAMLAWKSGLPVECFIAATNINKVVPDYIDTGSYNPRKSILTIANAMDVGNPSNFDRMLGIFDNDWAKVSSKVTGYWCNDDEIREHISREFLSSGYILDPHGAVASKGLDKYLADHISSSGIFVETAHPAKFLDIVHPIIKKSIPLPCSLEGYQKKEKHSIRMNNEFPALRDYLANRYGIH